MYIKSKYWSGHGLTCLGGSPRHDYVCIGRVIKIDSTKKIYRKLAGAAAGIATCQTNVGNEKREVLQSVVTDSEVLVSLKPIADGLMKKYYIVKLPGLYNAS